MDIKLDQILFQLTEMNKKIDKTEETLTLQMKELALSNLEELKKIKHENELLKSTVLEQEQRIRRLENQNRKNNIVVFGLEETEGNGNDLASSIMDLIGKRLNIDVTNADINFITRIGEGGQKSRSVLIGCTTWRLKKEILRRKRCLRNTQIVIKEDLPKDVREDRKEIGNTLIKMLEAGKRASIRGNKLFYNGKYYAKEDLHSLDHETSNEPQAITLDRRQRSEVRQRSEEQVADENSHKRGKYEQAHAGLRPDSKRNTSGDRDKITSFFAGSQRKLSC